MQNLSINKSGHFSLVKDGSFDHSCGAFSAGEEFRVKFDVNVICFPQTDDRDFLFRHEAVYDGLEKLNPRRFQSFDNDREVREIKEKLEQNNGSLERLVLTAQQSILKAIYKDNPSVRVKSIRVWMSPEPYDASVTLTEDFNERGQSIGRVSEHGDTPLGLLEKKLARILAIVQTAEDRAGIPDGGLRRQDTLTDADLDEIVELANGRIAPRESAGMATNLHGSGQSTEPYEAEAGAAA
jgi:hypothetical protein